jgi:hypothetical protein
MVIIPAPELQQIYWPILPIGYKVLKPASFLAKLRKPEPSIPAAANPEPPAPAIHSNGPNLAHGDIPSPGASCQPPIYIPKLYRPLLQLISFPTPGMIFLDNENPLTPLIKSDNPIIIRVALFQFDFFI